MADSYNELFGLGSHSEDASLEGWWPLLDDAASTTVDDQSGNANDGTLEGGDNTADIATTGPNSWLTSALHFDGSADAINLGDLFGGLSSLTLLCRINADSIPGIGVVDSVFSKWGNHSAFDSTDSWVISIGNNQGVRFHLGGPDAGVVSGSGELSTSTWYDVAAKYDGSDCFLRMDKSQKATGSATGTLNTASGTDADIATDEDSGGGGLFDGLGADFAIFSRSLTNGECDEWTDGPEPINSVAPVMSGTETEGQTLSCTTGTWGLDAPFASGSNGTITYAYQWTRSDNASGLNEADISGATSNSYTLVAADVGKFIRCRVAASNDGGNDSAADTNSNMSGAISSASAASGVRSLALLGVGA